MKTKAVEYHDLLYAMCLLPVVAFSDDRWSVCFVLLHLLQSDIGPMPFFTISVEHDILMKNGVRLASSEEGPGLGNDVVLI